MGRPARATGLPGPWVSVLSGSRRVDGPQGASPAAAVLPEIDGARFVLAGLSSWERHATVLVFAWGWSPPAAGIPPAAALLLVGPGRRRPLARRADRHARCGAGTFQLELTPPLHPARRSLDIILTGRRGRVTATLPLGWAARLAEARIKKYRIDLLMARRCVPAGTRPGRRAEVGMTAAERAETYLRLMAESELRRALAYPRHEAPGRLACPRGGALGRPPLQPAARPAASPGRGPRPGCPAPCSGRCGRPRAAAAVGGPAGRRPDGRAGSRLLGGALRRGRSGRAPAGCLAGRGRFAEPPAEAGLDRVRPVAGALVRRAWSARTRPRRCSTA